MGFRRYVEVGRVVLINYGSDAGKLAVIVDVADTNKVLVDGPEGITGVRRQLIPMKRISLTDIVVADLPRNAREKTLKARFEAQDVQGQWDGSSWARRLAAKRRRAACTDFDRFKVMVARKERSKLIRAQMA